MRRRKPAGTRVGASATPAIRTSRKSTASEAGPADTTNVAQKRTKTVDSSDINPTVEPASNATSEPVYTARLSRLACSGRLVEAYRNGTREISYTVDAGQDAATASLAIAIRGHQVITAKRLRKGRSRRHSFQL